MSKSTPLSQLKQPSNEDENNDMLVNEILKEIDSSNEPQMPQNNQQLPPINEQLEVQQQQEMMQQQMQQQMQQEMQQQMDQQMMVNQQQHQQKLQDIEKREQELSKKESELAAEPKPVGLYDNLMAEMKSIIIVAVTCLLISLPQVSDILMRVMPNKSFIINNMQYVLLLCKSLLGGIIFFLANHFS